MLRLLKKTKTWFLLAVLSLAVIVILVFQDSLSPVIWQMDKSGKVSLGRNVHSTWREDSLIKDTIKNEKHHSTWRKDILIDRIKYEKHKLEVKNGFDLKNRPPTVATFNKDEYPSKKTHFNTLKDQSALHFRPQNNPKRLKSENKRSKSMKASHYQGTVSSDTHPDYRTKVHWRTNNESLILHSKLSIDTIRDSISSSSRTQNLISGNYKTNLNDLQKKFPTVMIIGFGKAGTKALFELLKTRPDFVGPEIETRYFSRRYSEGLLYYLQNFPTPLRDQFVIEKSPDYITDYRVPNRISKALGVLNISQSNIKFIVVLRDPIDRAVSEHLEWEITRKKVGQDLASFPAMALTKEGKINVSQPFIRGSNYTAYVTPWLQYFNGSNTCFVDGDRFVKNPFPELQMLEKCLGLANYFRQRHFILNKLTGFYCFKKASNKLCMNKSKGRRHPMLPATLVSKLKRHFKPMAEKLFRIINRRLLWAHFQT